MKKRPTAKRIAADREARAHAAGFREGMKIAAVGLSAWVRRMGFASLALAMQLGHYERFERTGELEPLPIPEKKRRRRARQMDLDAR